MTLADEDEILHFAQDDTGRELRLMPSGRPQGSPLLGTEAAYRVGFTALTA